jgi:L-ascorbate metabolism protein UlaG (beta-lactamase superfamily)
MVMNIKGENFMLGPRDKGLAFTTPMKNIYTISVDETIEIDKMSITGLKATHGSLTIKMGPFHKTEKPGPEERIGWGAIGFQIQLGGKTIVNLGDSLLHKNEWTKLNNTDVLMIPIGGKTVQNTMDEEEALQAVRLIKPKLVIPCHYNCPAFFSKNYNPADDNMFKKGVEKAGAECVILHKDESIHI